MTQDSYSADEDHELRGQNRDSGGRRTTQREKAPDVNKKTDRIHYLQLLHNQRCTKESSCLDDLLNMELRNENLKMRQQEWEDFGGGGEKTCKRPLGRLLPSSTCIVNAHDECLIALSFFIASH